MMRHCLIALAAIWGPATALAEPPAEVAAEVVSEDRYPVLRARFPNGVVGMPDIVYARPPGFRPLTLDLYLPRGAVRRPLPLVIYVHGGAWMAGQARAAGAFADFPRVLASLAGRGVAVASINYRLSGEARYPAAVDDVRAAVAFLGANARRFGVDSSRVILWGSSAGAQLAALAATRCESAGRNCVQGVVAWYGIFDLATLESSGQGGESPTGAFLGCSPGDCSALAAEASPVTHVDASDPPFLILHGLDDRVVASEQSRIMERRLREAGVAVQADYLPGVGHSWIGATPEATRRASLLALQRTFSFIESLVRSDR
jgi:acetyl esterase/lipase